MSRYICPSCSTLFDGAQCSCGRPAPAHEKVLELESALELVVRELGTAKKFGFLEPQRHDNTDDMVFKGKLSGLYNRARAALGKKDKE